MAYKRKTEDEFQIHIDYGEGFVEVTAEVTRKAALATKRDYDQNEGFPSKIVVKRIPIKEPA